MTDQTMKYDSTDDTYKHIFRIRELIEQMRDELYTRGHNHDASKLKAPEKQVFDRVTPRLKGSTYGSDEYKGFLTDMGPALDHHYENNRHHPEHFEDGIDGMNLIDIFEMLADWKAATERHDDGDIDKSLAIQVERFHISLQLQAILNNTVRDMGWL